MANTLLIEKQNGGYFKFTLNGDTSNAITSIQNDLLAVGNELHFKTGNGANIIKEQSIYPADVTIVAAGTFTFTTVAAVWNKLIDVGYFDWLGGGVGGVDRFDELLDTFQYTGNAGKAVIVDNSELKLVPITLYNKRLFTELEDTPSSLVPDKMVVVNPAGTALILKDQPEPPEEYLNSVGYFDYNDLTTQTTPLNATANVALKLTNDTEGANTSTDQNPYGVSYVWDYTTNQFNFNELEVGDTIDVRVHVQVTTTSANQRVILSAKFGIGSVSEFTNIIYENQFKSAGLHEINFVAPFYMGSTYITDNPAELYLTTDSSATVKVDGWYVRILRKNINIITVDYQVPDATILAKGIVRLAGDLGGTANVPTVPELANKVPTSRTVSTTSPLLGGGALSSNLTLSIQQANSVDSGYLSNVDWSTFNNKQGALNGTGFVKISGTTIIYDNSTYALDSVVVKLTGDQSISGIKTFSTIIKSNILLINESGGFSGVTGYTQLGGTADYFQIVNGGGSKQTKFIHTGVRNITMPASDGTMALTSQLHDAVTLGTANGLSLVGQALSLGLSSASANGALSSTDWSTFNSKQGALNGTGFVKVVGTTVSYDNSTYALDSVVVKLTGNQTITGQKTFNNASVGYGIASNNTSTGYGIYSNNTANGNGLYINNTSTGNGVYSYNLSTGTGYYSYNNSTGIGFYSLNSSTGNGIYSDNNSTGNGIFTSNSGGGNAIFSYNDGTGFAYYGSNASTGILAYFKNSSSGKNLVLNNTTAATGIPFTIQKNGVDKATISDSGGAYFAGSVGIGTISPAQKLDILSGTANSDIAQFSGSVQGRGLKISTFSTGTTDAGVLLNAQSTFQSALAFATNGTESMRITSGGEVFIGKTAIDYTVAGSQFESNGKRLGITTNTSTSTMFLNRRNSQTGEFISFFYNDGQVGSISTNGTTTSYNITSDYRLKQDFKPFNGLDLVSKIKVYDYEWKADNSRMNGVIAHELQEVIPYAVTGEKDAEQMQSVDYSKLVPILVQAIQELQEKINKLENK